MVFAAPIVLQASALPEAQAVGQLSLSNSRLLGARTECRLLNFEPGLNSNCYALRGQNADIVCHEFAAPPEEGIKPVKMKIYKLSELNADQVQDLRNRPRIDFSSIFETVNPLPVFHIQAAQLRVYPGSLFLYAIVSLGESSHSCIHMKLIHKCYCENCDCCFLGGRLPL